MSQTLHADENRIDRPSQIILGVLNDEEWMFGEPLRDAADLGQNQQVFYRMDTHLLPAGLVEEKPRAERPHGYEEARQFRLTDRGADWVDAHASEIDRPATREETQQMVVAARDDAASAKASVQNYRKKLSRLKTHVEDLGEDISEIDRRHANDYDRLSAIEERAKKTQRWANANETAIDESQSALENRPTVEAVEALRDTLATREETADERFEEIEATLEEAVQRQADAQRERARLRGILTPASYLAVAAYLIVFVAVVLTAPNLLPSVILGGLGGVLGVVIGTRIAVTSRR